MLEPLHAAPAVATLGLISLILLSLLFPSFWTYSRWAGTAGLLILILSGIHATIIYHRLTMLYLVPIIMPIQIIGYGLGFMTAFIFRIILGKSEFGGFKKKYYK